MVNNKLGFTLLEVLMGLAVVSVLAVSVIPGMSSVLNKQTLKVKVSRLDGFVDHARNLAASTECPVQMRLQPNNGAVKINVKVEHNTFMKGCSAWYSQTSNPNSRGFSGELDNVSLARETVLNFNAVSGVLNTNTQTRVTLNYRNKKASITFTGIGNGVVRYE